MNTTQNATSITIIIFLIFSSVLFSTVLQGDADSAVIDKAVLTGGYNSSETIGMGEIHKFTFGVDSGAYVSINVDQIGCDLVLVLIDPDLDTIDIIDGPPRGPELVQFPPLKSGLYQLQIHVFEDLTDSLASGGDYKITVEELLSPQENRARIAADSLRTDSVSVLIKKYGIPLTSCQAGHGFEDLQPLKKLIGDARIVGLGEATHGTREFYQMKHRLLEFLVEEMGFDGIVFEASMPECFDIDRYIQTGEGNALKALAGQYFWTWDTQEVLALIEWMRSYNADPSHKRKIHFYGNDIQFGVRNAKVIYEYLSEIDPDIANQVADSLSICLIPFNNGYLDDRLSPDKRKQLCSYAKHLLDYIQVHESDFIELSSREEFDFIHQHANLLYQYLLLNNVDPGGMFYDVRDSCMAANTVWALEQAGPESRLALWAHNGHICTDSLVQGWYLRKWLGEQYFTLGMLFSEGEFQAYGRDSNGWAGLRWFYVPPLARGTVARAFADAGQNICILGLRNLDSDHLLRRWMSEPRPIYNYGAGFDDTQDTPALENSPLGRQFDALCFVDSTAAALANPLIAVGQTPTVQPILSNGNFELYTIDSLPQCWRFDNRSSAYDYKLQVTGEYPYSENHCLLMRRRHGNHYGEACAGTSQNFKARMWRGRTITVKVAARIEPSDIYAHAYIVLRGDVEQVNPLYSQILDSMICVEVTSQDWRIYEVQAIVNDDAERIIIGLYFMGEGKAWFDAVEISGTE